MKSIRKVADVAIPVVLTATGNPHLAAAYSAASSGQKTLSKGGSIGDALKSAAISGGTSYVGSKVGSSISGSLTKSGIGTTAAGSIGSANKVGPFSFGNLGSTTANSIGNAVANTSIANAIGGYAGNSIAKSVSNSLFPQDPQDQEEDMGMVGAPKETEFSPSRQAQLDTPASLTGFSSFTPEQQSSNLATQGVYGGGLGEQESNYFQNLINRRLIDDAGKVDSDLSEINPIESSYLSQLGLGGYSTPTSLLEALSKRKKAA